MIRRDGLFETMNRKQFGMVLIFSVVCWTLALACLTAVERSEQALRDCPNVFINFGGTQDKACRDAETVSYLPWYYADLLTYGAFAAMILPFGVATGIVLKTEGDKADRIESIDLRS